jgi:hypothetical protein
MYTSFVSVAVVTFSYFILYVIVIILYISVSVLWCCCFMYTRFVSVDRLQLLFISRVSRCRVAEVVFGSCCSSSSCLYTIRVSYRSIGCSACFRLTPAIDDGVILFALRSLPSCGCCSAHLLSCRTPAMVVNVISIGVP